MLRSPNIIGHLILIRLNIASFYSQRFLGILIGPVIVPGSTRPHFFFVMFKGLVALSLMLAGAVGHEWGNGESGSIRRASPEGLCDPNVKQESGYFDIKGTKDAHYFYWMFESRADPVNDPFILWMTGGPGCSSTLALLTENGPCHVNDDLTTTINPNSWTNNANMMWIDQPTGVGFSYGEKQDYVKDEHGVAEHMYQFLQAFFEAHPEYQNNDFYVTGESYGGHYVPAVSHRIWEGNNNKEGLKINLAGLAIGNGMTASEYQYPAYPEMAMNNTYGIKAVSEEVYNKMQASVPMCSKLIKQCNGRLGLFCSEAMIYCNTALVNPYANTGLNQYDMRRPCGSNPLCYDFDNVSGYLNSDVVKKALGVVAESAEWATCNYKVNSDMRGDFMKNMNQLLPELLNDGIKVLVYAGDADFICNWIGNKRWATALEWNGKAAFNAAGDHDWEVEGAKAGLARNADTFTFLTVAGAGHMVPFDQPEHALAMIKAFTGGKKL